MGIRAVNDRVLIRKELIAEKSIGGIYIPDDKKDAVNRRTNNGVVVSAGPGAVLLDGSKITPCCKEGDRVIFEPFSCQEPIYYPKDGKSGIKNQADALSMDQKEIDEKYDVLWMIRFEDIGAIVD